MDSLETPQEPPSVSLLLCKRLCWHKQKGQSSTETSLPFQTPAIFEHLLLVQCWVCSTPRHSGLRRSRRVLVQTSVPRGIPWDWGGVSFGRSNNYSFFGGCGFWSHLGVKCTCCWAGFWWKGSFVLLGAGASKRERERDRASTSWRVGDPLGRFLVKTFGTIGGFLFSTSRLPFDQRKFACLLGGSSLVNAF